MSRDSLKPFNEKLFFNQCTICRLLFILQTAPHAVLLTWSLCGNYTQEYYWHITSQALTQASVQVVRSSRSHRSCQGNRSRNLHQQQRWRRGRPEREQRASSCLTRDEEIVRLESDKSLSLDDQWCDWPRFYRRCISDALGDERCHCDTCHCLFSCLGHCLQATILACGHQTMCDVALNRYLNTL